MSKRAPLLGMLWAVAGIAACALPSLSSPTPFTFPTPNLTLTAIFLPTGTPAPVVPTLPPLSPPVVPSATPLPPLPSSGVRPNGSPVYAPALPAALTVDGDLAEWPAVTTVLDQCTYGCSFWSGASDARAVYAWGWDATFLYLAVRVSDDVHVAGPRGETMYRGDIVELQFDANLAGDFAQTFMSLDDSQFGLSPGDFGSLRPEAYRWYPADYAGSAASVWVRSAKTSEGYTLEASLPWTVLGATPAAGARYGFALSLSDNDAPGGGAQQSLVSSVRTRILLDPTSWGTLILQ